MVPGSESDREVLSTLKDDQSAFAELYETYSYKLVLYAAQFNISKQDAEELTQEVFMHAITSLDSGELPKNVSLKAWLYKIAKNIVIKYFRYCQSRSQIDFGEHPRSLIKSFKYRLRASVKDRVCFKQSKNFARYIFAFSPKRKQRPKRYLRGRVNTDEEASLCFPRHVAKILYLERRSQLATCLSPCAFAGT